MKPTVLIVVTTPESSHKSTAFYLSQYMHCDFEMDESENKPYHDVEFVTGNKKHLCTVYNEKIKTAIHARYTYIAFVHGDVWLNCTMDNLKQNIIKYNTMYDVFGLAGAKKLTIPSTLSQTTMPLWHLMGRDNLHGCVAHGQFDKFGYTSYGPVPEQVVMIDGVFISINLAKLGNVRFDENIPSKFHFYDLCFSLDCSLAKKKVGVGDLPIIHESPGLKNITPEWIAGANYFINKYSKYAGKQLTV